MVVMALSISAGFRLKNPGHWSGRQILMGSIICMKRRGKQAVVGFCLPAQTMLSGFISKLIIWMIRPAPPGWNLWCVESFWRSDGKPVSRQFSGIETAIVRIGSCFPEPINHRMMATWMSYDDFTLLDRPDFLKSPVLAVQLSMAFPKMTGPGGITKAQLISAGILKIMA